MKKLVVANWKMYPGTLTAATALARAIAPAVRNSRAEVVLCAPVPYLSVLIFKFPKLVFGAQDAFSFPEGPYTGAVAPGMLKSVGVRYVIAGHSERRANFNETDADIAAKVKAITDEGLTAILCVGEPLTVRHKGIAAARRFVAEQLKKDIKNISKTSRLVIAYEPVWAISTSGSGKTETPEDAAEMIRFIKRSLPPGARSLSPRVIYGGSVNAQNAASFLAYREIDGILPGRASLSPKEFRAIIGRS